MRSSLRACAIAFRSLGDRGNFHIVTIAAPSNFAQFEKVDDTFERALGAYRQIDGNGGGSQFCFYIS